MLSLLAQLFRVRWRRRDVAGTAERTHLPYFRHEYDAPSDILVGLRRVDPTADLLYLGWGKWLLVSVRPNQAHIAKARRALDRAVHLLARWEVDPRMRANPGAFRRLYQRYLYWLACSQGARPITDYPARFIRRYGMEAIVADFRRMDWMYRTATDAQIFDDNNAQFGLGYDREKARQEADADLRSEYRAMDGYGYLTRLTHGVTRHDDPMKRRYRSGFTTVAAIGADGTLTRTG